MSELAVYDNLIAALTQAGITVSGSRLLLPNSNVVVVDAPTLEFQAIDEGTALLTSSTWTLTVCTVLNEQSGAHVPAQMSLTASVIEALAGIGPYEIVSAGTPYFNSNPSGTNITHYARPLTVKVHHG